VHTVQVMNDLLLTKTQL